MDKLVKKGFLDSIPSFSLILIMLILMIIGTALIPLINISYSPISNKQSNTLSVSYSWPGASSRVIEQEVTSKVEGVVSSVNGVLEVSSISSDGGGSVTARLKDGASVPALRFELSSLLRQVSDRLPEGVSPLSLSESGRGGMNKSSVKTLLSYNINADMMEDQIENYVNTNIKPYIETIEGVREFTVTGVNPKYLELTYDPESLKSYGLDASTIRDGISNYLGKTNIIGDIEKTEISGELSRITALLSISKSGSDLGRIPLTTVGDKIIYLNDLVTINYKEKTPSRYYRVNGLNTIYLNIGVDADANLISMSDKVRERMDEVKANLVDNFYVTLTNDAAKEIKAELYKLLRRTMLSIAILLFFVWLVSRSMRYLTIIAITLVANVLIAVIFYYIFDVGLHIFSLAGIAVSFGLIIDTSIVMVDHYSYYRDRKVFVAILAALLTTIGSLVIIFFMPDYVKADLYDFSLIIIINLTVALFISLFFVPAIIDRYSFNLSERKRRLSVRRKIVRFSSFYSKYIKFTQKRKWIYVTILVLTFGVPIHLLPDRWSTYNRNETYFERQSQPEEEWYVSAYNKTIGGDFYRSKLKEPLQMVLGGTFRLFTTSMQGQTFGRYNNENRVVLSIMANMPEGSSIESLNEVIMSMENFLSKFEEISRFETSINGGGGSIQVEFKEEFRNGSFPMYLSNLSKSKVLDIGGADWSIFGIDERGFSNALYSSRKSNSITLTGYNYDRLYKLGEEIAEKIKTNKRISGVVIEAEGTGRWDEKERNEIFIKYDKQKVAVYDYDLSGAYNSLGELLSSSSAGTIVDENGSRLDISLVSSMKDDFDLWHLLNSYITVNDRQVKYSQIGEIGKRKAKASIPKKNQEYTINVAFDFVGSYELQNNFMKKTTEELNATLPIGFKCVNSSYGWYNDRGQQYWLLLLIVVIIFFMCSILFESLRQPLIIISLIPISFIGVFLTFSLSGIPFSTGGFAAMVLLSGLVVNAAIYIVNEYNNFRKIFGDRISLVQLYVKSYNHKIVPVLLTVLSTVLGLIPFLLDGKEEQFWFAFAIGTIGGLLFSIVALIFVMPIIMPLRKKLK